MRVEFNEGDFAGIRPEIGAEMIFRGYVTQIREQRVDVTGLGGKTTSLPAGREYVIYIEEAQEA